jgi:hypothetical protein
VFKNHSSASFLSSPQEGKGWPGPVSAHVPKTSMTIACSSQLMLNKTTMNWFAKSGGRDCQVQIRIVTEIKVNQTGHVSDL